MKFLKFLRMKMKCLERLKREEVSGDKNANSEVAEENEDSEMIGET